MEELAGKMLTAFPSTAATFEVDLVEGRFDIFYIETFKNLEFLFSLCNMEVF